MLEHFWLYRKVLYNIWTIDLQEKTILNKRNNWYCKFWLGIMKSCLDKHFQSVFQLLLFNWKWIFSIINICDSAVAKCYFCIQRFPSSSLDGDRFFLCPIINKFRGSKKSMGAQVLPKIAILQQLTAVMGPISPLFSKNSD